MSYTHTVSLDNVYQNKHQQLTNTSSPGGHENVQLDSSSIIPIIGKEKVHWLQGYLSKPVVVSSHNFSIHIPKLLGWLDLVMANYKGPIAQIVLKSPTCHELLGSSPSPDPFPTGIEIEIHIPSIDKLEKTMGILRDHLVYLAQYNQINQKDAFIQKIASVWEIQGGLNQPNYFFQATFGDQPHPVTLKFVKQEQHPLFSCDSLQVSIAPLIHWMNEPKTPAPPPLGLIAVGNGLQQAYTDFTDKNIRILPHTLCDLGAWDQACQRLTQGFFYADEASYRSLAHGAGKHKDAVLFSHLLNVLKETSPLLFELQMENVPFPILFSFIQCAYLLHGEEENLFSIKSLEGRRWLVYHGMALCPFEPQQILKLATSSLTKQQEQCAQKYLLSLIPCLKPRFTAIPPEVEEHAGRFLQQKGLAQFLGAYLSLHIFEETMDREVLLDLLHFAPKLKEQKRFAPLMTRLEEALNASPFASEKEALLHANQKSAKTPLARFGGSSNANVAQWACERWEADIKTKETISIFIPHHPEIAWRSLFKLIDSVKKITQNEESLIKHCLDTQTISAIDSKDLNHYAHTLTHKIQVSTKRKKGTKPCPQSVTQFLIQAVNQLLKQEKLEAAHTLFLNCIRKKLILPNQPEARELWLTLCQAHLSAEKVERSISLYESGDRQWKEKTCHKQTTFILNLTTKLADENHKKEDKFYQVLQTGLQHQGVANGILPDIIKYLQRRMRDCIEKSKWRKACKYYFELQKQNANADTLRVEGMHLLDQLVQVVHESDLAHSVIKIPWFQELFSESQHVLAYWVDVLFERSNLTANGPEIFLTRLQIKDKLGPITAAHCVQLLHHHPQLNEKCKKAYEDHHSEIVKELLPTLKAQFLHGLDIHNIGVLLNREEFVAYLQAPHSNVHSRQAACRYLLAPTSQSHMHLSAEDLPAILTLLQGISTDYALEILDNLKDKFDVDDEKKQIMTQATTVMDATEALTLLVDHHDFIYQESAAVTALRFDDPATVHMLMTLYKIYYDEVWLHLLKLISDGKATQIVTQTICNTFLQNPNTHTRCWDFLRKALVHHPSPRIWEVFDETDNPSPSFIATCKKQALVECPSIPQLKRLLALDLQNKNRSEEEKEVAVKLHLVSHDEILFCSGCTLLHEWTCTPSANKLALTVVRYGASFTTEAVEQHVSAVLDSPFLKELSPQQNLMLASLLCSYKHPHHIKKALDLMHDEVKPNSAIQALYSSVLNKLAAIVSGDNAKIPLVLANRCFELDPNKNCIAKGSWRAFILRHLKSGLADSPAKHLTSIIFFIYHYRHFCEDSYHKEFPWVKLALESMAQLLADAHNIKFFSEMVLAFFERIFEELPGHKKWKKLPKTQGDQIQIVGISMANRPNRLTKPQQEKWTLAENKFVSYLCYLLIHTHRLDPTSVDLVKAVNGFSCLNVKHLLRFYQSHTLSILEAVESFIIEIDPREESLFEFRRNQVNEFLVAAKYNQNPYYWMVNQYLLYMNYDFITLPMKFTDPLTNKTRTIQPVNEMISFLKKIVWKSPGHLSRALKMVSSLHLQLMDNNPKLLCACYEIISNWMIDCYFEKGIKGSLCHELFLSLEIPSLNRLVCANGDPKCQQALFNLIETNFLALITLVKQEPNAQITNGDVHIKPIEFFLHVLNALLERNGFQYHYIGYFSLIQALHEYAKASINENDYIAMYKDYLIELTELNFKPINLNAEEKEAQKCLLNSLILGEGRG